ncbi:MAG: AAA family ATPase, partial [Desulfobulbaceae bacterium]|nr:AAA family ATPase [Desulfobulbaceae bacterium]
MYTSLYKLETKPFEPQPDPSFLWLGGKHKEALSVLQYGILDNLGFVLLTGAAGTGKTVLINDLARGLKSEVVWAVISEPDFERIDFYNKIGMGFGIDKQFISKVQFLIQFSHFLHKAHDENKKVVLFIDDCHLLSQDILEELHLLSNIEKADAKLIDIFFIGQPEFTEMLAQPKNRAVRQRLGLKARLVPLGRDETVDYINHRLKISGNVEEIFSARAFQAIHQYSQGVPRFINMICEKALQAGSLEGKTKIDHKLILESVQKLELPIRLDPSDLKPPPVEEKQDEQVAENFVPREIGRQAVDAGLIAGKRKRGAWIFSAMAFLVCVGLGFYFFSPKKEIPVVAETDSTAAVQNAEIVSVPQVSSEPVAVALAKDSDTVVNVQKETELDEAIPEEIPDDKVSKEGPPVPAIEVAQLDTGEIEMGQLSENVEKDEKKSEVQEPVIEGVVPVVEPEQKETPALPPLEPGKIILRLQPGKVRLTADANRIFTDFVETLLQYPEAKVVVKGFVSSNNDSPENTQLSTERAANVRDLLI